MLNDIKHKFIDIVSTERILQWRAAVQELIRVGFVVEFLLDHLWEIAWVFFMKKVQPAVDAIDARIEALKKEVANWQTRRHVVSVSFLVLLALTLLDIRPLTQAFDEIRYIV